MTDAEIEQERQRIEPPLEPLYVDSKAEERSAAFFRELVSIGAVIDVGIDPEDIPYEGDGSIVRPFLTVQDARKVQKPGQSIVIAGYATIGAAAKPPVIPQEIKERCS